ncbi:MAG TPA: Na/Pi cotransporter family protein, partial [Desulfobacterales bacterium]|nr:Na/Pi cotransporter family protein [Desulfobacterales bacterium]
MNGFALAGSLAGGIGLFLLGMGLMTDGLKYAAGRSLKTILAESTRTRLRGILAGCGITALVQSSSAVTVATIGFVNAGLMDLAHAVSVIYGANIGTTMTGWLVSLVGFKFDLKALSMPFVGGGMLLRAMRPESRQGALGEVLAGFGVFFLGIDVLKQNFAGVAAHVDFAALASYGGWSVVLFVLLGFLLTTCMQSSSAAIALVLTAVATGVVGYEEGAALIVGANVGTTTTAALAVIGATVSARRLAMAHVGFNIG